MLNIKTLGAIAAGVFAGAVLVEVLNKKNPKLVKNISKKVEDSFQSAGKTANKVKEAFVNGYKEATKGKASKASA